MKRILVTGCLGQIGSELVKALWKIYGAENVVATDIRTDPPQEFKDTGVYLALDATDKYKIEKIIQDYQIDTIYHLAGLLSATGEKFPQKAWDINISSLFDILELGRQYKLEKIFWPSSIAAFGPTTPQDNTPNDTILQPTTMYGVTKVTGELLLEYYWRKYGLDTRCMRLPGIISSETPAGGGTTDYAVEIYYEALLKKKYTCFLKKDTVLPMMFMPDLIKAILDLMNADSEKLKHHVFNITGMSFSAEELVSEIKKHIPELEVDYKPDFRQAIADSWPHTIDDSCAREEWNWKPDYGISEMTTAMLKRLRERLL
ncbi:MAG: NAD-dependent epimerase/dehydratase family protein [Promethearchaeota archaeon]